MCMLNFKFRFKKLKLGICSYDVHSSDRYVQTCKHGFLEGFCGLVRSVGTAGKGPLAR